MAHKLIKDDRIHGDDYHAEGIHSHKRVGEDAHRRTQYGSIAVEDAVCAGRARNGDQPHQCQHHEHTRPPPVTEVELFGKRQVSNCQGRYSQVSEGCVTLEKGQHGIDNGGVDSGNRDEHRHGKFEVVPSHQPVSRETDQGHQQGEDDGINAGDDAERGKTVGDKASHTENGMHNKDDEEGQPQIRGGRHKAERAHQDQECPQRSHDVDGLVREERAP